MNETDTYYHDATTQPKEDADPTSQIAALREQVAGLAQRAAEFAGETSEEGIQTIDGAVRENPYLALGFALVAGIAIGSALKR